VADWRSGAHRDDHFMAHGRSLGCHSIEEYDASIEDTLRAGTYFEFAHEDGERVGCYDSHMRRLVVLDDEGRVVNHFRCIEAYVRGLPYSTYG
jgi:hypothetical protein